MGWAVIRTKSENEPTPRARLGRGPEMMSSVSSEVSQQQGHGNKMKQKQGEAQSCRMVTSKIGTKVSRSEDVEKVSE